METAFICDYDKTLQKGAHLQLSRKAVISYADAL
jgi:hypothetical protein